jgi:Copper type II ascorbate-dependent monooxygenase, C-terminal domain
VLQPKLTGTMYLTGYTFLPNQVEELHHAQVFHISPEQKANAARISGKDGKPGWECYGSANLRGRRPQQVPGRTFHRDAGFIVQPNLIAGWVPGQVPVIYPEHAGILLNQGDALVLQIHYHYSGKVTPDTSGLALQLDKPNDTIKAMRVVNPLGPVEVPCAKGAKEKLCDRDAALKNIQKLYGTNDETGLLALCGKTPEGLTKNFDGVHARSSCDSVVPEDGIMTGVLGHMHTLGKTFRLTIDPGTKDERILLDIPNWSFDWQMNYQLQTPIHVKAGEKITMECSWDRSVDPNRPQRYIVFAEDTEDEMCFGTYSLIPDDQ